MNPTVSENRTLAFEGSPRSDVGSSVANMRDDATTLDWKSIEQRGLSRVRVPHQRHRATEPTRAAASAAARMRRTFSICCLTCRTRR